MKRFLVAAVLVLALASTASAQSPNKLGIKGGLNMFKPYGDDVMDVDYYTSFAIGGFYAREVSEIFVLQPEIYYSVKGGIENDEDGESTLKLSYIDIPVLLKFNLPIKDRNWAPNLYAGPYLAFLMGADVDGNDVKDFFKSTDFGLVVGAGIDFRLGEGKNLLNLDFRYSMGMTKIYDLGDEFEVEAYNNGFQFLLGYGFSI
jgi:hypothetical protein